MTGQFHDRPMLNAALGFDRLAPRAPDLRPLHHWLDTWLGIGDVAAGIHRQGYDLQLTEYDERAGGRASQPSLCPGHRPLVSK